MSESGKDASSSLMTDHAGALEAEHAELMASADREALARHRYHETDQDLIRESKLIEQSLRLAAAPPQPAPVEQAGEVVAWQNPCDSAQPLILAHQKEYLRPEAAEKYNIALYAAAQPAPARPDAGGDMREALVERLNSLAPDIFDMPKTRQAMHDAADMLEADGKRLAKPEASNASAEERDWSDPCDDPECAGCTSLKKCKWCGGTGNVIDDPDAPPTASCQACNGANASVEALEQRDRDIGILLANIRFLEDTLGESLEDEDASMVRQIEREHKDRSALSAGGDEAKKSEGGAEAEFPAWTDEDEAYQLGRRDGYESAVQDLDLATGGDGEFRSSTIAGETVDVQAMKKRIIGRICDAHPSAPTAVPDATAQRKAIARGLDTWAWDTYDMGMAFRTEKVNARIRSSLVEADRILSTNAERAR